MAGRYLFHDLLTGEEKDLYDANTDDATLAIYAVDGLSLIHIWCRPMEGSSST